MGKRTTKVHELTPQLYLTYKKRNLTDAQIGEMYDCTGETVRRWKREHDLIGKVNIRHWEVWERLFPDKVEKLKKRFLELYNQGWKHTAIAEELEMSRGALTVFKNRYFPEIMTRVKFRMSEEQRRVMEENGILYRTAIKRINLGMDPEEAIRKPVRGKRKEEINDNQTQKNQHSRDIRGPKEIGPHGTKKRRGRPRKHN